jgi:hypothetical protein
MADNKYAPPNSLVADLPPTTRSPARGSWYIVYLSLFTLLNAYIGFTRYGNLWSPVLAALSGASVVLLWRRSPRAKYPVYALTLLMGSAIPLGVYNYIRHPVLLQASLESQIISWLIPGIPIALLIACCVHARRFTRS